MLVGAALVGTGALMNAASRLAREPSGDMATGPYGWAGSKFWRAGAILLVVTAAITLVQAVAD